MNFLVYLNYFKEQIVNIDMLSGYFVMVCCNFRDVDRIVSDSQVNKDRASTSAASEVTVKGRKTRIFKQPEMDEVIVSASKKKFAPLSRTKIKWATNMFNQWRISRISQGTAADQIIRCNLENVTDVSKEDLCYALSRFIREARENRWK